MKRPWWQFGYQLDRLMVSSFVPPFLMSFSIALFVLIMQFLWKFIDDIIGKGVGALVIMEMFFYKSVSLFPLALPIAVLLASVMVLGNLAERYELSSLKSAGVPLTRIMLPLFMFCLLVAGFSFYCSNTMIPIANLKYQSRLYDIRNQKPTLSIEAGVFNEDFKGSAIRVGKKHRDNQTIEDILVYDETPRNRGLLNVVTAQKGKMYVSEEDGAFVLTLYDGYQYSESEAQGRSEGLPFVITHFDEWTRRFDLGEFDLDRTEEEQFKSHHSMKSARQIMVEIDTMDEQIAVARSGALTAYKLFSTQPDTAVVTPVEGSPENPVIRKTEFSTSASTRPALQENQKVMAKYREITSFLQQHDFSSATSISLALPEHVRREYQSSLTSRLSVAETTADRSARNIHRLELNRRKHVYELHWKFSLAAACIVMLLIGGPMGAIVRKGGFGYPLLVAIFFFTFFIMSNISCKKLNDTEKLHPVLGAWLPVIVLAVISFWLMYKALNDVKWMDFTRIKNIFSRLFAKRKVVPA